MKWKKTPKTNKTKEKKEEEGGGSELLLFSFSRAMG